LAIAVPASNTDTSVKWSDFNEASYTVPIDMTLNTLEVTTKRVSKEALSTDPDDEPSVTIAIVVATLEVCKPSCGPICYGRPLVVETNTVDFTCPGVAQFDSFKLDDPLRLHAGDLIALRVVDNLILQASSSSGESAMFRDQAAASTSTVGSIRISAALVHT
jgi:hypothetical protein